MQIVTFIDTILRHESKGRIHAEFHQLRSDDGGTVTGRFSSSNPNLQQIPSRDKEIKKLIRGLFVAEKGCKWGSFDYASQEPRLLVHYASLTSKSDSLKSIVNAYKTYKNLVSNIAEAKEIISTTDDPEMKELAKIDL